MNRTNTEIHSLYSNDKASWEKEADARMAKSKDERIEQIRSRAYRLKANREAERLEFVKDCYHRQWRDSCDEMRVLQSKELLNRIVLERKLDTQKKVDSINNDKHPENMCVLKTVEVDEQQKHRESIIESRRALDKQIELKKKQTAATAAERRREEQEQMRLMTTLEEEARESERRSHEKAKQRQKEMFEDKMQRYREKQIRRDLDKHQDAILLQRALALEQETILAEQSKKHDGKEASQEFIRCLKEQTQHEEIEKENVDRIRAQQMDRLAKKIDERMAAEEVERQMQQEQIKRSREQQILKKLREADMKQQKEMEEVEENKSAVRRAVEVEIRNKEKAKAAVLEVRGK